MLSDHGGQLLNRDLAEIWQRTLSLAFIEIDGKKILHQLWQSDCGRSMWKPIVEISKQAAETGVF